MAVREAMLALLTDGPRHGYQLKAEFEDALTAPGTLNAGQVYTTLDRLVRDGLVDETDLADLAEAGSDERRKPFQLTPTGRHAVQEWLLSGPPPADRSRDELITRILLAVHTGAVDVLDVVDAQRRALVAQLQDVRQQQRKVEGDLSASLVADAVASTLEADLGWLDRAEARLDRPSQPNPPRPTSGRRSPTRSGARRARRRP